MQSAQKTMNMSHQMKLTMEKRSKMKLSIIAAMIAPTVKRGEKHRTDRERQRETERAGGAEEEPQSTELRHGQARPDVHAHRCRSSLRRGSATRGTLCRRCASQSAARSQHSQAQTHRQTAASSVRSRRAARRCPSHRQPPAVCADAHGGGSGHHLCAHRHCSHRALLLQR